MSERKDDTALPRKPRDGSPKPATPLRVLSLGAGVQSSTLYLMAIAGEFGAERPEVALFADTAWEPEAVYRWLDELDKIGGATIPIRRRSAGSVRSAALDGMMTQGGRMRTVSIPAYVAVPVDDPKQTTLWTLAEAVTEGALSRQCTGDFKLAVIRRAVREYLGVGPHDRVRSTVEQWIGISTDEADRMTASGVVFVENRYPLIERGMSRDDCATWLREHGYAEPPKSACIGCPFTSDARWAEMKAERPDEFADAVDFDERIRRNPLGAIEYPVFLHRSLKPLREIVFNPADKRTGFSNDCKGMCGV